MNMNLFYRSKYPKSVKILLLIIFALINFQIMNVACAQYIYNDCVTAMDFGQANQENFVIRPIGEVCYQRCDTQCQQFSKLSNNIELNADIIDKCNIACRSGNIYSSKIRTAIKDGTINPIYDWSTNEISTSTYCAPGGYSIDGVAYNQYDTKIRVGPTNKVQIKLVNLGGNASNAIYLCGFSTTIIVPAIESLKKSYWDNNRYRWINSNSNPSQWNARNTNFTDTGVDIKDGDYLSITYGGQYRHCQEKNCNETSYDKDLFIMNPDANSGKDNGFNSKTRNGEFYTLPASKLQPLILDKNGNYIGDPKAILSNNMGVQFMGLKANIWRQKTRFGEGLNFTDNNTSKFNGDTYVFSQDTYYSFSGILNGFSQKFTRLGIAHPEVVNWNDNLGGYLVNIVRKGCQFTNGERLQYAIGKIDPTSDSRNPTFLEPQDNEWIDLTKNNIVKYEYIDIQSDGLLYLRIKPQVYDNEFTPTCSVENLNCMESIAATKGLYSPQNTTGQYYVQVVKTDDPAAVEQIVTNIVNIIKTYLFGDDNDQQGMVQVLFNRFVSDSNLLKAIRALIVLYMAFTGISFMMGIAQFTQREGVIRLLKIGVVLTLIAPDSWKFFNDHLFKLFTIGSLELLVRITADPSTPPSELNNLLNNPTQIFTVFNEPFRILFGKVTWIKITALIFSGSPIGPFIALIVVLAVVIYAICIAKATLLYLLSLIGISVLLLMAPIFISFILFQYTKQMFDSWLKQLMSFAFQPIFVFAFIIVINYLVLAALKMVLGFSACSACWFSISIPTYDSVCIIPGYITLYGLHNPSTGIGVPMQSISAVFYLLILIQGMYVFTTFGASLANMIVTSMFAGINLSSAAQVVVSESTSMATKIIGIDKETRSGGMKVRNKFDANANRAIRFKNFLTKKPGPQPNPPPNNN